MDNAQKVITALTVAASVNAGMGFYASEPAPYDDNTYRSKGARNFKRKRSRRKIADKSKRANRR